MQSQSRDSNTEPDLENEVKNVLSTPVPAPAHRQACHNRHLSHDMDYVFV